ncbi:MAG: hypothetical protein ACFCVK_19635 [Acidimicrobiales bacterium]
MLIKRRITPGIPAALTVWVSSAEAYAELQFDDDEPATNEAPPTSLQEHRVAIEATFGGVLDWRTLEANGLMTKRTKVVTPKVAIGAREDPTQEGLHGLADMARRLVDAVKPFLSEAAEKATAVADDDEPSNDAASPISDPSDSSGAGDTPFQAGLAPTRSRSADDRPDRL